MLTRLVIHDVVLIEKLDLGLSPGLNVFTGETGAGKSILLDALSLALGERGDAGLVRGGAAQASVAAEFTLPDDHGAFTLATDQGLTIEAPLILRRVLAKDGKSRAFVNDQPVSIGLLKQFGALLLEIHGQFETHGLLNPATHRGLLDSFAGTGKLRLQTATAYRDWQAAAAGLAQALADRDRAANEEEFLRAAVQELDELSPETGEADALASRRTTLQHREKIIEALDSASRALNGERKERGATSALAEAGKAVARVADKLPGLPEILTAIDRAGDEAAEAAKQLQRFMAGMEAEPETLQQIEERLFALRAVARKHNVATEGLAKLRQELSDRLTLLTDQSDRLTALAKARDAARAAYRRLAEQLSEKRKAAAVKMEKAIAQELPPLKLERARFVVDLASLPEDQWAADGLDRVSFLAVTNPGAPPAPLQKIASGGELARFMLALKVVLAASDPVPVLVFDEVDAGIGGATAAAVGERLARLAQDVQILVVTHSPQVAALGDNHLRVAKQVKNQQTTTGVDPLTAAERVEEIARMLAGTQVTDAARQAAASLMDGLAGPVKKKKAG